MVDESHFATMEALINASVGETPFQYTNGRLLPHHRNTLPFGMLQLSKRNKVQLDIFSYSTSAAARAPQCLDWCGAHSNNDGTAIPWSTRCTLEICCGCSMCSSVGSDGPAAAAVVSPNAGNAITMNGYCMNFPFTMVFPLTTCPFENSMYPCPRKSHDFLTRNYGPDWNISKSIIGPKAAYAKQHAVSLSY